MATPRVGKHAWPHPECARVCSVTPTRDGSLPRRESRHLKSAPSPGVLGKTPEGKEGSASPTCRVLGWTGMSLPEHALWITSVTGSGPGGALGATWSVPPLLPPARLLAVASPAEGHRHLLRLIPVFLVAPPCTCCSHATVLSSGPTWKPAAFFTLFQPYLLFPTAALVHIAGGRPCGWVGSCALWP